ncbi:ATP-binding protein [Streptomyces sp. NPDC037389]|uniref:ATP-binding protein n=1 Tax=Streptomyces sp. NPDC037389 TaxID=3155369 RepID=UPI0034058115
MSDHIFQVVIWCLVVAVAAVAVLLIRQRSITAGLRRRVAQLEESVQARDEEIGHLVGVRLPAVADAVNQEVPLPGPLDARLAGTLFALRLQDVMDLFAQAVEKAQSRADQSAKAALKASMRALQGLAHEQQLAISEMQERHDNPDVLRDLLEIDHANAQFGRRAQAIAVLCGSWPGRQRVASPLTDVVRGATSRIRDYRRVRVHSGQNELAVVSRVVEPVVLAVAELLDNAARHSQPNTIVEVSLQPVHNGACVVIDDAGVGMDGREIQEAVAMLSGRRAVDVSRLGDPPQFGFPVIGVLAARYGFSVSVDTRSPYGGVRAVLFLPSALLTQLELDGPGTTPLRERGRDEEARHTPTVPAPRGPSRPRTRQPERTHAPQEPPAYGGGADRPAEGTGTAPSAPHATPHLPGTSPSAGTSHTTGTPHATGTPHSTGASPNTGSPHGTGTSHNSGAPHSPGAPDATGTPHPAGSPHVTGSTAGGLPKRRRRQPGPGQQRHSRPAAPMPPTDLPPERSAEETARRMGAFARGTRTGRTGEHHLPPLPGAPGPGPLPERLPQADAHAPTPVEDEGNPHA